MNNRTQKDWVNLFINHFLKNNKNLPYTIQMSKCIDKNPRCDKHHAEMVVKSYNKEKDQFCIDRYGMHESEIMFQFDDISDDTIRTALLHGFKIRLFNTIDLKKKLNLVEIFRIKLIQTKVSKKEKQIIQEKAKMEGMSLSVYIRHKALS